MSQITVRETGIEGLMVIEPTVHRDERGFFVEFYNERDFAEAGIHTRFVQDNVSRSVKGVLRGLHFQKHYPQAKLVRAARGRVFDVAVDLRKGSETFGKWASVKLTGGDGKAFFIPRGFAHGFMVVSDYAEFAYKCDDVYHPEDEGGIMWNDPAIGIEWPEVGEIILSEKDKVHPSLAESKIEF